MTMTLEQVRDWHLARDREQRAVGLFIGATDHAGMAATIDAHLTQTAQSVDVAAKDAEIERLTWANRQLLDGAASADRTRLCSDLRDESAEFRLAATNALLREVETIIRELCSCYSHPLPQATLERIQSHLQGAGDEA